MTNLFYLIFTWFISHTIIKEEKDKLTEIVSLYGIEEERSIAEDTLLYQLAEEVPHFLQQESGLSPYLNWISFNA